MQQKSLIQWVISLNILIMLVFPTLNTAHYDPLPEFWAETTFVWAVIILFLIVCYTFKQIYIPKSTLPLLLFGAYLALQPYLVKINFVGLSYVAALEMFICALLAVSVSTLIKEFGLPKIVSIISSSLVVGAILQSIIGLLQYSGLYRYFGNWIFYDGSHPTTNIFGHFGQRNHYCHYLSWGVFGLIYLFHQSKIRLWTFLLITAWLIFSITIAASRSVFIYFTLASITSGLFYFINKIMSHAKNNLNINHNSNNSAVNNGNNCGLKLFIIIIAVSFALVSVEYLYPLTIKMFAHHNHISTGLQRISSESEDSGIWGRRLIEWQKSYIVFQSSPIWGKGFNQYAQQSVYLQPLFPHAPLNSGLFTNCHNLIMQLLAETGIVGAGIIIIGLACSIYGIIRNGIVRDGIIQDGIMRQNNIECTIILCMIFTTISHSMVEYPLWYIYFLGPLIIFLSTDQPIAKLSSNVIAGTVIIPLASVVYLMFQGSFIFNALVYYIDAPTKQKSFTLQSKYLENLVNHNTFFAYPALYTLDSYITVDDINTNQNFSTQTQLKYENELAYFHPYPDNMIKQAMLNWNLGNKQTAKNLVELALIAFPVYKNSYLNTLKARKYQELYAIAKQYQYK